MYCAIILDSNGVGIGQHVYAEEPSAYPSNEVACTQEQANNPSMWSLVSGALVESLAAAQTAQTALLSAACAAQIVGGFTSSALGVAYTYPSQPNDQSNLIGCVSASLASGLPSTWTCGFWCSNPAGTWAIVQHTAAQIQKVLADGVAAREALSTKLAGLVGQVEAATTVASVQAVVW